MPSGAASWRPFGKKAATAARGQFGDGSTPKFAHYILVYLCAKIGAFIKKCTIGLNIIGKPPHYCSCSCLVSWWSAALTNVAMTSGVVIGIRQGVEGGSRFVVRRVCCVTCVVVRSRWSLLMCQRSPPWVRDHRRSTHPWPPWPCLVVVPWLNICSQACVCAAVLMLLLFCYLVIITIIRPIINLLF